MQLGVYPVPSLEAHPASWNDTIWLPRAGPEPQHEAAVTLLISKFKPEVTIWVKTIQLIREKRYLLGQAATNSASVVAWSPRQPTWAG